jgi:hypothetical protein
MRHRNGFLGSRWARSMAAWRPSTRAMLIFERGLAYNVYCGTIGLKEPSARSANSGTRPNTKRNGASSGAVESIQG